MFPVHEFWFHFQQTIFLLHLKGSNSVLGQDPLKFLQIRDLLLLLFLLSFIPITPKDAVQFTTSPPFFFQSILYFNQINFAKFKLIINDLFVHSININFNNNNKINDKQKLMQINDYEQILIKCEYINAVCDSLLKELQKESLSKQFIRNKKLIDIELQNCKKASFYQLNSQKEQDFQYQDKNKNLKRDKELQFEMIQSQGKIKKLKKQISLFKQHKLRGIRNSSELSKKIRQQINLQSQINQYRRLFNCELQNLNCIDINAAKMQQSFDLSEQKYFQIKRKIDKYVQQENLFIYYHKLEEKYDSLLKYKKRICQQNIHLSQHQHSQMIQKVSSIAQSNQNLLQMQKYQNELHFLLKQQQMIINEIQERQSKIEKQKFPQGVSAEIDLDDDEVFEEEIVNLRKTIANRKFDRHLKFKNKNSSVIKSNFNSIHDDVPTPKNTQSKSSSNHKPIFKIQFQPLNNKTKQTFQMKNNVNKILKTSHNIKSKQIKPDQPQQLSSRSYYLKNQNNFNDGDVQIIRKILKKKQQEMVEALKKSRLQEQNKFSTIEQKNIEKGKQNIQLFNRLKTQPMQQKNLKTQPDQDNSRVFGPNSRFIQKIIQENDSHNLQRLKNNVRIRTKQSQIQRYKIYDRQSLRQKQNATNKSLFNKKRTSLKIQDSASHEKRNLQVTKSKAHSKPKTQTQLKQKITKNVTAFEDNQNQFLSSKSKLTFHQTLPFKAIHIKYKQKVQTIAEHINNINDMKGNIQQVMEKINKIKNQASNKLKKQKTQSQSIPIKIEVIKVGGGRKQGGTLSFLRKGLVEAIQYSDEQEQMNDNNKYKMEKRSQTSDQAYKIRDQIKNEQSLSKIQEVEEQIRNTKDSIQIKPSQQ